MRKRFLSVLLALSMFISVLPTTFAAQTATSSGTISGTPDSVKALSFEIKNGILQSFNITPGTKHGGGGSMSAMFVTDYQYDETDVTSNDLYQLETDFGSFMTDNNAAWENAFACPYLYFKKDLVKMNEAFDMSSDYDKTYSNYTWADDRGFAGAGVQYPENCKVVLYILSGTAEFVKNDAFKYEFQLDANRSYKFPEGGGTEDTEISTVALNVTAPKIGATPATTATTTTTGVVANPAVTWDPADSTFAKNQAYKASVTLSADSGYKFTDSTTATINGKTATVTLNGDGTLKAEYTFDAIKLTGISSNKTGLTSSFAPNDSYTPDGLEVTLRYSDGTEEVVPYNKFPENNLSLVIGADSATATDLPTKLTLDNNNQTVYVKYSGTDTNDGNPKYQAIDTITVANAKITTAQVSVTYPKPGETPDTVATVPSDANYTAEVTWQDSDGADVSGNFEYDKAYNAIITVKPNTGYALDNTNGVALTVKDKTAANPGADKPATIASDDIDIYGNGVKTVSFDATASTPISASISDSFDLYDKNDVNITLTLGTHVIGDITGITIDGQTLSSSDYTISGNIITVKGASLATKLTDLTSTAANKNVEITVTGQTTATTTSLSAVDTTPYITITNPSQGAITSSPTIATGTRVALTKGTAYTLTAPTVAHTTGYTWTVNGITGTDGGQTYTFTPSGSEDITATVALTVDAGHKLTINKTGTGSGIVTVAKDGGSTLTAETDGTYTVYSDEKYTVTATADNQNKVTAVTGETISGVQKTVTHAVANPTADTTVEVTFATKTAPTVSADMTYRKGTNDTDKVFTITLGDYSDVEIGATTPSGTWAVDKATYTVSKSDLETASNGDHTYTFDFGEGMTITKKISVLAARSIENVTAPTGPFAHGDTFNLTGLSFTVKEDGIDTKYTYDGTNWDKPIPTETKFSLDGSTPGSDWDTFKTVAEAKITRHDTTDSNAVNNGAQITVSLGTPTKASNDISVGTKAITVNPSQTTDINKVYDGTVTAPSISATIPTGELVGDDKVTASVTAVYQDGVSTGLTDKNASDNVKNVVFTGTLSGANAGNYTIKAIPNGSGKINKRTVKIAIINNVPAATKNKADTQTGNATATIPTNTEYDLNTPYEVVDGETVAITYDYLYATISSVGPVSDVTVRNIATTNTNYTVEPTYLENQNGTVNNRTIKSIAISDPTKKEYNYSDTFDPTGIKVTVTYDGETDSVVYAWNDVPDDITLKWTGTDEALSATHKFDSAGTYTITASATGVGSATTGNITVNKLKVNVTASGNITKVYDGKTDLDADDAITYDVTNQSAGYDTQFNADTVTVSNNPAVYDGTSVSTNGVTINKADLTLSNSNYEIENFTNNVTASITARHITVTAITVPTVKQYSNDTDVPVENVGTSAVTFDNVVSGENVTVDYKYTYNDTSVAGDTSNITINNLVLNSTNTVNNNYTLDESILTKSGHVDEREVDSLTVTAPTQFATAQTYGTALALAGLKVQVNFTSGGTSDGSETYVWKNVSTWTKQVEGQTDVDVTTVPFTLAWSGTTDVPTQGETLNVQRSTKGITASYTGTSVTGTSDQITVNPITLTKIKITGTDQTKVYDGNADLTPNPAFTYAITEGIINSDPVTVAPNTVEYAEADVHTSEPLNITGFHLTNNNDGNYALGTPNVTGTPNGTITKRPITLTAITNIPAINRFEAGTGTDQTATSAANGGATFEAAGTDTGIVSGQTVTVIYNYEYDDNQTVSNNAVVNLSNVRLDTASDKNYSLTNNATATGVVNEVEATAVTVTIPDKTYEYGDKLDLTGTTVTVDYGNTNTEVYTSDDGVNWKKNNTAVSEKPFTITLPTDKDSLAVGTATVSVKVKDGVEDSVSRTVNKRKVTVTPAKNGDVTKVYNGNTTYTNGVIEWTVRSVNSIDGLTVTLPTVSSATYTYNDSAVALANKITVSDPQLSDTNNFEINGYTDQEFDATITLRPLVITGITIPDVNKYADVSQEVTGETANSATNGGATFEATGTDTGIVSGETVGVTFDYKYVTSNPESGTTTDVDISNIALDNRVGTSANYSLTPNSLTGSANVVERTIDSITVANPTQFNSDVTYNDKLSIAGLKVTINYTDRTSEVYTATVVNDVVSWALGSVNISADNIPFTLSWKDTAKGGTFAQGQTLSVTGHNGNQIVANHKNGNDSGEGSAVTIKPIEITSINATKNGDITKTYNGDTELNDASKSNIGYTSTQVIGGDTVTLGATPAYENKNVGQNKAISFTTPTVSGNDNYTLGTDATVTGDVVGDITVKTVEISNVYIPSIYKDTEDLVKSISNASAIASGHPTANTVVAADILSGDRANLTFAYELTYANSTDDNPTVTISDTSITGTESGNYEFAWPTGLTGTVIADAFTDATITAPTNMSYTHGDTFNPTGLSVTIKTSSHPTGTTYTVTGTEGNYKWDTDLPAGVNVSLGSISLNSNDALNFKAHYKNMKDQKIKVSAGEKKAETGVVTMLQKQLTATASIDAADKTYDSTTGLTSDQHVTYKIGDNGVQSFNGTADNVSVTANASYKDANVSKTDTTINNVGITFTNIGLDGDDKDNYIAPTSIEEISGKINPYTINITAIGEVAPTAYYKIAKSGTIDSTVDYIAEMNGLTKPAIKFNYDYGDLVNTVASSVTVPISNIAFVTATDNFVIGDKPSTIKGSVEVQGIQKIEITKDKKGYKYGDTLDLSDLSVKVTYVGGETKDGIRYNDTDWNTLGLTLNTTLPTDGTVLKNSTDNGKTITVEKDTVKSNAITLKVDKKDLHLTAEKADGLSAIEKTYDTTTDAKSILKFGITSADLVSDDSFDSFTVDSSNVSATFDTKNQGSDKDITISGLTITGDNSDQYNVIMPSGVKGTIKKKVITVKVENSNIPPVLKNSTGNDLKKKVTSYSFENDIKPYDVDNVTFDVIADYTGQDVSDTANTPTVSLSLENVQNDDNYTITVTPTSGTGSVVDNLIETITVTGGKAEGYVHGDELSLQNMVITVTYQNDRDNNVFTYVSGNNWTAQKAINGSTTVTTSDLPVSLKLGDNPITDATQQLRYGDNKKKITVLDKMNSAQPVEALTLGVSQKEIKNISVSKNGDITKPYDGTNTVNQPANIAYDSTDIVTFGSTKDNVTITATTTYENSTAGNDKVINIVNYTLGTGNDNGNYYITDPQTGLNITGNVTGNITKATLTVTITSVPAIIIGADKKVDLVKDTDYTQNGEVTVDGNKETVDLTVHGTYQDNTTEQSGTANVDYTTTPTELTNYNIVLKGTDTKGTVNKKPVTKIEVTSPTKTTWSHGDDLTLDGMTITVTYNNDDTDKKQYKHMDGKWHDVTGGSDTELSGTPDDVTITWGDTNSSATDGVIRLDDINKGLTPDDNNNKTTSVKVTSTVKDTNGEYQSASTGDITLTKKQLTLTVSGNITKPYDNTRDLSTDNLGNVSLTLDGVAGTDGVTLNETATKNNIKYAGTTVADTASSPKLVIGTVVLADNANNQYYTLPSGASITNSTTGKINKRPVQITSVTKNMNTSVDASTTGTLEKLVQSTTDGYGISSASGCYSILSGHVIKVDIPYRYSQTSAEGPADVIYDKYNAKVSDENADYVANYDVSFDIAKGSATISNGTVTGVKIETTGKTEYTHGDSFDLTGTKITVTYNNGAKQDTYEYDTSSGKWIKNGTGTPAELPSEIGISLGNTTINANPASDTDKTVVKYDKTNTTPELKATYTKSGSEPISSTENPTVTLKKKTITITVANGADEIKHTYSGNNSLTDDEITKLTITEPTNFKVGSDDVTLTKGTLSATIGSNTNGNVDKNLAISVSGYELSGNDADKYEIKYVSTATGDITKAPLTITISSVPSINENATDLKKILTKDVNYTQSGEVTVNGNKETVNATVQGTYPNSTYTGGSADKNVSYTVTNADEYPNYDITISGSPKGTVTQKTATVEIINQPKFVTDTTRPQHGDKLGTDGLNGFEYTVSYSDGTTTKHKYENGDWLTTDGYTEPENGTVFTWTNTNTPVSSDSEIRRDMDNKIKITVPTATNEPFTNKATADKKKVKITANGTYTKVYDGTNTVTLNETTPEITYTVSGVATGDTVTVTATPAFVDENVAKFGDVYQKAINFTNVSIKNEDGTDTDNYEIVADENGVVIAPIMGAITPKTINITALTVPSSTKGSAGEKTVTKNKNFTTTDILEKDKDNVTIGYKATFVTSATGTVDATVTDAKVDGSNDQMTLNYVVGTVTGAKIEITSSNPGGGGGGGGGGNSLSIKYENADGTAGKDVSKIEAPAGSDPVDLIAVFVTKPANPTVIWTSDNESVATVDENGIVKFIGEGTAIITAQSKTNKTLKDTVTVTVTKAVATPTPKPANPTPEPTKEPSIITKTMLNPYIVGYDDNVFGPELPISREEVSAIFARLIANNIYMDKEYDTSFPDVGEGWSKDYIGYLEKFSVVTGYEDGTFRPQNYITRAEMAVMMAKAEGYDISGYMSSDELAYPDVDEGYSEWAVKAIKYLTDRGIMEGYPDGTFGPNRPITRAETVATVNRVLADMTVGNIEVLPSDMTEAHWAYNDVVFAMNHRILKDVAADESQFIKSEEYDKNKITETEVVEDTSDENAGAGASPTPEPSPTPNA